MSETKVVERKLGRHSVKGHGVVGFAHFEKNKVEIDPRQKPKAYLDTLIHEKMHLLLPEMSETKITKIAKEMTNFLWKLKYRQIKE